MTGRRLSIKPSPGADPPFNDVSDLINDWFADRVNGRSIADWNAEGVVNSTDVSDFINAWFGTTGAGCTT